MRFLSLVFLPFFLFASNVKVQILGSGGPELDHRASASYLIWVDNKAKLLIDFGGGAFVRMGEAKAELEALDLILFTHFHIDHVVDFAALVKASYFSNIRKTVKVLGPDSNRYFPDTNTFLKGQFDNADVYGYMSDALNTDSNCISFKPYVFNSDTDEKIKQFKHKDITIDLIGVKHGNVPALAYRVTIDHKSIVFSGDTAATTDNLIKLAKDADLLIAHHALPEHARGVAKSLHMIPSRIGEIAHKAAVKKLILGHRMHRTIGEEKLSIAKVRNNYNGEILLAEDLLMVSLTK
jgi:ribonuclease BN (tRNA processing enzyme)